MLIAGHLARGEGAKGAQVIRCGRAHEQVGRVFEANEWRTTSEMILVFLYCGDEDDKHD
jgi:hypothetical protein